MRITLPDDLNLPRIAAQAGFTSVDEYVRQLVQRDREQLPEPETPVRPARRSPQQWQRELKALRELATPCRTKLDDSRASIYSGLQND